MGLVTGGWAVVKELGPQSIMPRTFGLLDEHQDHRAAWRPWRSLTCPRDSLAAATSDP